MGTDLRKTGARFDWRTALMLAVLLNFVCRVLLIPYTMYEERWRFLFGAACAVLTGPVLFLTDAPKNRGQRLLIAAFCWMLCICLLRFSSYDDPRLLFPYLLMAISSLFLLYPAAGALGEARGKRLLTAVSHAYIAGITILAAIMLVASFSGVYLPSPSGSDYMGAGVDPYYRRIMLYCNTIEGAVFCAVSLLLAFPLWLDTRRKWVRVLLGAEAVVLFLALSLSDARTASWMFCVCAGGAAYLLVSARPAGKKGVRGICVAVACALVTAVACFFIMRMLSRLLQPLVPELDAIRNPGHSGKTFTGRTECWAAAIRMLRDNPEICWFGAGPYRGMAYVHAYGLPGERVLLHMHNIVLQTVITFGIPGALLFAAFALYAAWHAAKLFFLAGERCTISRRALPLLLFYLLAVDMMECSLSFCGALDMSNPWFFLVSGYVVYLSSTKLGKGKVTGKSA